MTSDQFDALARALTLRAPRRSALAALLGAAMPTVAYARDRCRVRDSERDSPLHPAGSAQVRAVQTVHDPCGAL